MRTSSRDGGHGQRERRRRATNVTSTVSKPRPPNASAKAAPNAFCARSPEPGVRINVSHQVSQQLRPKKKAADVGSVLLTNSVGFTRTPF